MPKASEPKTGLEAALQPAFERQKKIQAAAKKVVRALSDLNPQDAKSVLEMVVEAHANPAPPQPDPAGDDKTGT